MDKTQLHQQVIELLRTNLAQAEQALRSAHESATHEENIAENKYDTLGLEAAYLALGQARRVEEIRAALAAWTALPVLDYDQERGVRLGTLVELQNQHGKRQRLLLGPDGAGLQLAAGEGEPAGAAGEQITLITPRSPLGQRLLGLAEGDCFEMGASQWELLAAW